VFETLGLTKGLPVGNMIGLEDGFKLTFIDEGEDGLREGGHVGYTM
jgi:hypothetical protein